MLDDETLRQAGVILPQPDIIRSCIKVVLNSQTRALKVCLSVVGPQAFYSGEGGKRVEREGGHELSKYTVPTSFVGIVVATKVVGMMVLSALPRMVAGI